MAAENVSRRERLGRVLAETTLGAQVLLTAGENVTGERLREAYNEAAEAVAAAVDAEYAPLLTIVGDIDREVWEDGAANPYTVGRLVQAVHGLRFSREES